MHKKVIALAIAGLASAGVYAQSNVTVYGLIDMGFNHIQTSGKHSQNNIDSSQMNGSRLGFKGSEDLGNGLKGLFVLEYGISPDDNSGLGSKTKWSGSMTRQAYVGLSDDKLGTLVAGRLQGAAFNFACSYSPLTGGIFQTDARLFLGDRPTSSNITSCGNAGRTENAVGYISPSLAGFTVEVNHIRLGSGTPSSEVPNAFANVVGVTYRNTDLQVGVVYNNAQRGTLGADFREYGIGATYDFKVVKMFASYANNKIDNGTSAVSFYQLGASVPVSAKGAVVGSFAKNNMNGSNTDSKIWSLAYQHNLSKRTMLYAGYSQVKNESGAGIGMGATPTDFPANGDSSSIVGFGMRHSF